MFHGSHLSKTSRASILGLAGSVVEGLYGRAPLKGRAGVFINNHSAIVLAYVLKIFDAEVMINGEGFTQRSGMA